MKKIILFIVPFLYLSNGNTQAIIDWANSLDAAHNFLSEIAYDIVYDADNNIYITGFFDDSVDFDPGIGEAIYSFGEDQTAAFIAKYNSEGDFIWVVPIGSNSGQASGSAIRIDANGDLICTGWVYATVDFDPSPAVHQVSAVSSAVSIYVAKYDNNGNYKMAFAVGGNYSAEGKAIFSDADNNILVIGNFGSAVDFDPSAGNTTLNAVNFSGDLFFAKYTTNGELIFAKQINAMVTFDNFDHGDFAEMDADGNIFLVSIFSESIDADPDAGTTELTSVAFRNVFFAKYNSNMELIWAKKLEGGEESLIQSHALTLDEENNIFIAGWFRESVDMDPTAGEYFLETTLADASDDMFFAKYTNSGELIWAKTIGGNGYDYARNIKVSSVGNIYISGDFYIKVDFDPGPGEAILEDSEDAEDGFIVVYDNNGNYLNASQIKGDLYNETYIYNMELDASDGVIITGCFSQQADFDCSENELFLQTYGGYDIFLARYGSVVFTPNVSVENLQINKILLFPNPASDYLFLLSSINNNAENTMEIFSMTGVKMAHTEYCDKLDIRFLSPGWYVLKCGIHCMPFEKL